MTDAVYGWTYQQNGNTFLATDPQGRQHTFKSWSAFWQAAEANPGAAAPPSLPRTKKASEPVFEWIAFILGALVFAVCSLHYFGVSTISIVDLSKDFFWMLLGTLAMGFSSICITLKSKK